MYKQGFTYIMSNKMRTTFYIGVTNDLAIRIKQHRSGTGSVFTSKYKCYDLVYFERHMAMMHAIEREKQLKNWHRDWKINLIRSINPDMKDLAPEVDPDG